MSNVVNLEFAGDASKLAAASKKAEASVVGYGDSVMTASDDLKKAAKSSEDLTDRMSKLGSITTGATDALDAAGGGLQALVDVQDSARAEAMRLARAASDVSQAMEDQQQAVRDASQALIDGDQATVDLEQAQLDAATAQRELNEAIAEHGEGSEEARQASIDLKQAGIDVKQAQEDSAQAIRDGSQAAIDAKSATLDLAEAQHEANPPDMQKWADQLNLITPLLTAMMGATALVTAAQWAWNAAQLASPTTWIILAIVALIAVIVLIATKTTWFQTAWKKSWSGIKAAAEAVGSWFKDTLWGKWIRPAWDAIIGGGKKALDWYLSLPGKILGIAGQLADAISSPFRSAFNSVARAWNNTVGQLSWTVPGWVPGIGGNSISVPNLPTFHQGGKVPGAPGQEVMAIVQAGERVTSLAGSAGGGGDIVIRSGGTRLDDLLVEVLATAIGRRGGNVQTVLGRG